MAPIFRPSEQNAARRLLQEQRLMGVRIILSAQTSTGVPEILMRCLEKWLGTRFMLNISEVSYSQAVLDTAQRETVDLFIPVLNNMIINDHLPFPADNRIHAALNVVSFLKQTYGIPAVTMAGWWPEDWNITQKAKEAGANAFFVLPASREHLMAAVQDCLEGKATWRTNLLEGCKVGMG